MRDETPVGWLTVIFKLPSQPSTLRVNVWKQVKELGGLALQQSTYLLPDLPETRTGLARLQRQVEQGGGETTLLEIPRLDAAKEHSFVDELRGARDDEYAEVAEDCEELVQRLKRKTERGRFDPEESRDARDDLARARHHFEAIVARDYFDAGRRVEIEELLAAAELATTEFGARVVTECGTAPASTELGESVPRPDAKNVKEKVRKAHPMDEAIAHARSTLDAFEAGRLTLGDTHVDGATGPALLELKYADRNGKRCLEIEIEWKAT